MQESEIVQAHVPCEECGSSDGATIYTDHKFCFVCEKWTPLDGSTGGTRNMSHKKLPIISTGDMEVKALKARGITSDTCRKFHYYTTKDDWGKTIQVATYFKDGKTTPVFTPAYGYIVHVCCHNASLLWC